MPPGRPTFCPAAASSASSVRPCCGVGWWRRALCPNGSSRSPVPPSATWPRPSRFSWKATWPRPPRSLIFRCRPGSRSACYRCEKWVEEQQRSAIVNWWRTLPYRECFILNKLLTGELRVGVSELLVTRALSEALHIERADVTRRIMGEWHPSAQFWEGLRSTAPPTSDPRGAVSVLPGLATGGRPRGDTGCHRPTGWPNGNGTASAASSSAARGSASSGPGAKTS